MHIRALLKYQVSLKQYILHWSCHENNVLISTLDFMEWHVTGLYMMLHPCFCFGPKKYRTELDLQ